MELSASTTGAGCGTACGRPHEGLLTGRPGQGPTPDSVESTATASAAQRAALRPGHQWPAVPTMRAIGGRATPIRASRRPGQGQKGVGFMTPWSLTCWRNATVVYCPERPKTASPWGRGPPFARGWRDEWHHPTAGAKHSATCLPPSSAMPANIPRRCSGAALPSAPPTMTYQPASPRLVCVAPPTLVACWRHQQRIP